MVRRATVEDADAIGALHVASWRTHYRGLVPDEVLDGLDIPEWQARRQKHLADPMPGATDWVSEADGRVVGWCVLGPCRDPDLDGSALELFAIYLDPPAVGQGHGRALWLAALEAAQATDAAEIVLHVLEDNARARAFYERAGFVRDDRVPVGSFYGASSIRMRRPL